MAAPSAAPLNTEPAQPEVRKKQHLSPKSYADAVEQEPPANGAKGSNDPNGANGVNGAEADDSKQTGHKASVLRIVDTGAPETKDKQEDRPQFERQESKHEYSATVSSHSSCPYSAFTYDHKRDSMIPRELLPDTNIGKPDPKVAIAPRINRVQMRRNQSLMGSRILNRPRSRMIERMPRFSKRSEENKMAASS
jgi:hypothetical protein